MGHHLILVRNLIRQVDTYSLGNVMYLLLVLDWPFYGLSSSKVYKNVGSGIRPNVSQEIAESPDPSLQALKKAMEMCFVHNQYERPSARDVEVYLKEKLEELDPGRIAAWEAEVRAAKSQ